MCVLTCNACGFISSLFEWGHATLSSQHSQRSGRGDVRVKTYEEIFGHLLLILSSVMIFTCMDVSVAAFYLTPPLFI